MPEANLIFVYGTLKRGFANSRWMEGLRLVGETRIEGVEMYLDCGTSEECLTGRLAAGTEFDPWPYLVFGEGSVIGEVYECSGRKEWLERLDQFEGLDEGLYARVVIDTEFGPAYLYVGGFRPGPSARRIERFEVGHQGFMATTDGQAARPKAWAK
jgi:gamma-glutamylcyclotransferase (GGCT)/AIG2-like uncharacterized protein YtfP